MDDQMNDQVMGDEQETAEAMPVAEEATEGAEMAPEMPAEETGEEEVA
jgi:hypothetical protein